MFSLPTSDSCHKRSTKRSPFPDEVQEVSCFILTVATQNTTHMARAMCADLAKQTLMKPYEVLTSRSVDALGLGQGHKNASGTSAASYTVTSAVR